ncbi:PAS domain S-box protein [Halorussus halophilus]|uniref:PAS domain S-box protein n=1 Tax=Halorussus halophilus TaxID=2650975 RepID=UPI0013016F46|nr:PAS domain S-box protein [Halorussus halophilus]
MGDRIRVLLVDDDEAVADLTATYLRRVGENLEPTIETNPTTALDRLANERVDCVVSDYDMPEMNGLAFFEQVRELDPDLPFVLFTGKGSEEIASEAISAGVTDYLQKSTGTEQYEMLANRVENAVAQHRAEIEAAEASEQTRRLFERVTDAFFALDDDWRFRYVNERAAELFGQTREELLGSDIRETFPDGNEGKFHEAYERAFEEQVATTVESTLVVDSERWVEARAYPAEDGISVYGRDVSERKQMESELRETKGKIESLYDVAARAVSCTTEQEIYDLAVAAAEDILAFDLCMVDAAEGDELVPKAVSKGVPTDGYYETTTLDADDNIVAAVFHSGESNLVHDVDDGDHDAAESQYRSALTVPLGEFGVFQAVSEEPNGFDYEDRELTELLVAHLTEALRRIDSERELRAERDRFAALFENVPNAVVSCVYDDTQEPRIRAANPAFEETFGRDASELVGEPLDDIIVPPEREREADDINERVREGECVDGIELRRGTDGDVRDFLFHTDAIEVDGDTEIVSVYTDITDQKERERELARQNDRLDEFASVISHDLRNPLNVAQGRFEMLAEDVDDNPHVEPLERALDRMDALVADVLTLTRQGDTVTETEPLELRTIATDAWATVDTADATLRIDGETSIEAAPGRLRQLLENLFRNSVEHGSTGSETESHDAVEHSSTSNQASPDNVVERGSTARETESHDAFERGGGDVTVTVGPLDDGGFYVADDGPGIAPDEREQVFDHGYTTATDGTGFGLAIVSDIAEAHGWSVALTESEKGGARFEIRE